jgi:hypothetical protein
VITHCVRPHVARLPPASPHRYDGKALKVFYLHSITWRLVAHDRLVRHPASLIARVVEGQPARDRGRRPAPAQPPAHHRPQPRRPLDRSTANSFGRSRAARVPLVEVFRDVPALLKTLALPVADFAGYYLIFLYMATSLQRDVHMAASTVTWLSTLTIVVAVLTLPLFEQLADRWGRKAVLGGSAAGYLVLTLPMFLVIGTGNVLAMAAALVILALVQSATMDVRRSGRAVPHPHPLHRHRVEL